MFNGISQIGRKSNIAHCLWQVAQLSEQIALVSSQLGTYIPDKELSPAGRKSRDSYLRQRRLMLQSERQVVYNELILSS